MAYALLLREALKAKKFRCFLDDEELAASFPLRVGIAKALRSSTLLLLIGSPCALESQYALDELRSFSKSRSRKISAIDIGGTLRDANPESELRLILGDSLRTDEDLERLNKGPSERVLGKVSQTFRFIRRNIIRTTAIASISTALILLLGTACILQWISSMETVKADFATKQRQVDHLTTDADQSIESDPRLAAQKLIDAMKISKDLREPVAASTELAARRWLTDAFSSY